MNKIAAFLFYGFFGSLALLAGGVYLAGQSRADAVPEACVTKSDALAAVLAHPVMRPRSDPRSQIFLETERGIEVTLIFEGNETINYSVAPDCTVRFA